MIVKGAVCTLKPDPVPSAVKVAEPIVEPPVSVKVAVVAPEGIVTEAGETDTREAPAVIARLIVAPVEGAG